MGKHYIGEYYDGVDDRGYSIRGFIQKISETHLWVLCHGKMYILPNV